MTPGWRLASIFIIPPCFDEFKEISVVLESVGIKPLPPLLLNEHCLPFFMAKDRAL